MARSQVHPLLMVEDPDAISQMVSGPESIDGGEISRVIFDRSIDSTAFLRFVGNLPAGFTGDVLFIRSVEEAFLSSIPVGEGRGIYLLGSEFLTLLFATSQSREERPPVDQLGGSTFPSEVQGA